MTKSKGIFMSQQLPNMSTLMRNFKTQFLDNYNIGVRRFAEMTNISRTKLVKFFSGEKFPTDDEVMKISAAMDYIVAQHHKEKDLMEKRKIKEEMNKTFKEILETMK